MDELYCPRAYWTLNMRPELEQRPWFSSDPGTKARSDKIMKKIQMIWNIHTETKHE